MLGRAEYYSFFLLEDMAFPEHKDQYNVLQTYNITKRRLEIANICIYTYIYIRNIF